MSAEPRLFPVQITVGYGRKPGAVREEVYMAAYEVYSVVYGKQEALIDLEGRNCRGGFGTGELVAFLYARFFPRAEWNDRVDEALRGMNV